MTSAIFYKEWIKTKAAFWILFGLMVCFTIYIMYQIFYSVEFGSQVRLWNNFLIDRKGVYINQLQYLPVIAGIVIAFVQFTPEVTLKRMKLTLHVPYPQNRMLLIMVGIGVLELLAMYTVSLGMYTGYLSQVVCKEIVYESFMAALPWFIAGIAIYIMLSAVILEPTWRGRLLGGLLTGAFVHIFFISPDPQVYAYSICGLTVVTLLSFLLVLRSIYRFKQGLQD